MKKLTILEQSARDAARISWNQQCKAFMMYNTPFIDKTSKDCYNRYLKQLKP